MELDIRKISFPINIKLTLVVLLLTGSSLLFYTWLAIDLFKTDKIAYVFESVDQQNNQVAAQVTQVIKSIQLNHELLKNIVSDQKAFGSFQKSYPSFLGFIQYKKQSLDKKIGSLDRNSSDSLLKEINQSSKSVGISFSHDTEQKRLNYWQRNGELVTISIYHLDILLNLIPKSDLYHYNLVLDDQLLIKSNDIHLQKDSLKNYAFQTFVDDSNGIKKIMAIIPLFERSLGFLTWIDYQKALEASQSLQDKSLYFGVLVAGVVIIFILIFSSILTKPIKKLYESALELANSNFSHRTQIKQTDEIGVLGDSFNYMAHKIEQYMEQMQEKLRLENEMKTAQLVQKSFFPTDKIEGDYLSLKAFYRPASECGGDWWGYLKHSEHEVIILLDVTGHGTAAALMTAIAHNSLTSLKYLAKNDESIIKDSSRIMDFLNKSLCAVDINLNATCFVGVFGKGSMNYTNASHNPPFLLKHKDEYVKNDFFPLLENIGTRLGESVESTYISNSQDVSSNDHLVLYTDGILEAENSEGKQFGNRNFIKALSSSMNEGFEKSVEMTISKFYEFIADEMPNDDISLIRIDLK